MKTTMIAAQNPASRPPNWLTNRSCPGANNSRRVAGPNVGEDVNFLSPGGELRLQTKLLNTDTAKYVFFQGDSAGNPMRKDELGQVP